MESNGVVGLYMYVIIIIILYMYVCVCLCNINSQRHCCVAIQIIISYFLTIVDNHNLVSIIAVDNIFKHT